MKWDGLMTCYFAGVLVLMVGVLTLPSYLYISQAFICNVYSGKISGKGALIVYEGVEEFGKDCHNLPPPPNPAS